MQRSRRAKRSTSVPAEKRDHALSLNMRSNRFAAIDLTDIKDVPTAACVELSRSIMKRPEVNTGSFFAAIAASNSEVNRSDAVIVITSAILECIGNKKAANSMLNKSRTVSEFYDKMNLNDERVRTSFVIMLFTIAPEFVKMLETSLKLSLERVQKMTEAPHAENKLLQATGELLKDGSVSPEEHATLLNDMADLRIKTDPALVADSIQNTPTDGIAVDDSISNVGKRTLVKDNSPLTTLGIMRYVKQNPKTAYDNFYTEFPNARRPISIKTSSGKTGLGYNMAASAVTGTVTESNFSVAMNEILNPYTNSRRHRLSNTDKSVFPKAQSFVTAETSVEPIKATRSDSVIDPFQYQLADVQVTMEDISAMKQEAKPEQRDNSRVITNTVLSSDEQELLDLL